MVGLTRLELVTPRLSSVCSNQLSYRPSDTSMKNNLLWILTNRQSFVKEVIQPQVPLRLPCYDFTPIIGPTVDGCSSCELAHRLRVKPTFVV